MNWIQKTINNAIESLGYEKKGLTTTGAGSIFGGGNESAQLKNFKGWVFACVRAIAEELSATKFELYKVNGQDEYEREWSNPILDILERPNTQQSGSEFFYVVAAHLELVGEAFVLLDGVNSEKGAPKAMYVLPPDKVKVIDGDTIQQPIKEYKYTHGKDGKDTTYQPYEILHLKNPNPSKPWRGVGTLESIAAWVDTETYATEFNRRFFINGAKLSGVLETDAALTTDQIKLIRESFNEIHRGVNNSHKVAALPKGVKYTETKNTQKEMDYVESQRDMRDKILAGFRVPKTVLGITDDVNRANAEATNYVFALRTIKPKMVQLVQQLQDALVSRYQDKSNRYVLSFEDPVPENREQRIEEMKAATNNAAVLSINEARDHYFGLEPINNGDAVLTELGKVALGAPKEEPKGKSKMVVKASLDANAKSIERAEKSEDELKNSFKALADVFKVNHIEKAKELATMESDDYEAKVWDPFVTRVTTYENQQKAIIEKYNENITDNVIAAIESKEKALDKAEIEEMMDPDQTEIKAVIDLSEQLQLDLYEKEAIAAGEVIGLAATAPLTDDVTNAIKEAVTLMAKSYSDTTAKIIGQTLEQAAVDGLGLDETIEMLRAVQQNADFRRAETVARTESFRVANMATRNTWETSDVVKSVQWFTAQDEIVCEFCGPHNGKEVGISEAFHTLGETVEGSDGGTIQINYSDIINPPLHPNCRCYIKPKQIQID